MQALVKDSVTIAEAARILEVSAQTLRRWDASGTLVADRHPVSNYRVYSRRTLEAFGRSLTPSGESEIHSGFTQDLVGRNAELAIARKLIRRSRVLAVTGVAGIGKSAFWKHLLAQPDEEWPENLMTVDLSCPSEVDITLREIACVLSPGLRLIPGKDAIAQIARVLHSLGDCLVVLDSVEWHKALDSAIGVWLDSAPGLRLLITSRQRPGCADGHLELAPLCPEDGARMFEQLVRRGSSALEASAADRASMREIARVVGGNPLAIQFAASMGSSQTPAQIVQHLALLPAVLGTEGGIGSALAKSWQSLSQKERRLMAQLSLLPDGFFTDTVYASLATEDRIELAPRLQRLCDMGLLQSTMRDQAGSAGPCFSLPESVREYAARQMPPAEKLEVLLRLHAHFSRMAAIWRQPRSAAECLVMGRTLQREHNTLLAIADGLAVAHNANAEAAEAILIVAELPNGVFEVALIERGVALARAAGAERVELELVACRGRRFLRLAQLHEAETNHRHVIAAAQRLGIQTCLADGHRAQAEWHRLRGELEKAIAENQIACDISRRAGWTELEASATANIGICWHMRGDLDKATEHFKRAYKIARNAHLAYATATFSSYLARSKASVAAIGSSIARFETAIGQLVEIGDQYREGITRLHLGEFLIDAGSMGRARNELLLATQIHQRLDDQGAEGASRFFLAQVELEQGNPKAADKEAQRSQCIMENLSASLHVGLARQLRGWVAMASGDWPLAQHHLEAAQSMFIGEDGCIQASITSASRALALAALGDAEGSATMQRAARASQVPLSRASSDLLDLLDALCDLQKARRELPGGLASTSSLLVQLRSKLDSANPSSVPGSFATRFFASLLRTTFAELYSAADEIAAARGLMIEDALLVGTGGRWFRVAGHDRCNLARRPVLSRLFERLVDARVAFPGQRIAKNDLMSAVWPGERSAESAIKARLWVAVRELRNLGLAPFLVSRDGGYLLDPQRSLVQL